jgi:hypothetical protein
LWLAAIAVVVASHFISVHVVGRPGKLVLSFLLSFEISGAFLRSIAFLGIFIDLGKFSYKFFVCNLSGKNSDLKVIFHVVHHYF